MTPGLGGAPQGGPTGGQGRKIGTQRAKEPRRSASLARARARDVAGEGRAFGGAHRAKSLFYSKSRERLSDVAPAFRRRFRAISRFFLTFRRGPLTRETRARTFVSL
jgi:hypothetical protein